MKIYEDDGDDRSDERFEDVKNACESRGLDWRNPLSRYRLSSPALEDTLPDWSKVDDACKKIVPDAIDLDPRCFKRKGHEGACRTYNELTKDCP